jgi:RNA polymerase sigma-70 factor (ECF subfamily)
LRERLREALARLPPENAELFVLCYLEGYSYDELADMLQMERGTVGSRLHRIRATLQKDLGDAPERSGRVKEPLR